MFAIFAGKIFGYEAKSNDNETLQAREELSGINRVNEISIDYKVNSYPCNIDVSANISVYKNSN